MTVLKAVEAYLSSDQLQIPDDVAAQTPEELVATLMQDLEDQEYSAEEWVEMIESETTQLEAAMLVRDWIYHRNETSRQAFFTDEDGRLSNLYKPLRV